MWRAVLRRAGGLSAAAAAGTAVSSALADAAPPKKPPPKKPPKLAVGGVEGEYTAQRRSIRPLDPPLHSFFAKEIDVLGLPVRAHADVSDSALVVAADRLSRMLRHLPSAIFDRLSRRQASFHIIGLAQGTSALPEHKHMQGVDGGYTGERGITLDQRARGMGGVQSSCGEENLIDLDSDPRYPGRDILTHEFAHCIMDVGLPPVLRTAICDTYEKAVHQHGRWKRDDGSCAYAGSCASEYWAELTMWWAASHLSAGAPAPSPLPPSELPTPPHPQVLWDARRVCGS